MICSNGKEIAENNEEEKFFICQVGKYKDSPCPWIKFCHVIQLYDINIHAHGGIKKCNNFSPRGRVSW